LGCGWPEFFRSATTFNALADNPAPLRLA